jgi:type IV pilus assembly protein PilW
MKTWMKSVAGFSMVELMVAMAVGLIVLVGVTWAYLGNRATYVLNEEMARMNESARIVLETMRSRHRLAGNFGCLRLKDDYFPEAESLIPLQDSDPVLKAIQERIVNYSPVGLAEGRFTVYGALAYGMGLLDGVEVSGSTIKVAGGLSGHKLERFVKGNASETETKLENPYLVIGDCDKAVLFKATAITIPEDAETSGQITVDGQFSSLPVTFGRGTQIWGINVDQREPENKGESESEDESKPVVVSVGAGEAFERKDSGRKDLQGNAIYSLFYNGEELVEGVEDFRICVAEEKGGELGALKKIEDAGDLRNARITQVEIDLVLGSIRPRVLSESMSPNFSLCGDDGAQWIPPGATAPPSDFRLRRLFTTSVALRSKVGLTPGKEKEN